MRYCLFATALGLGLVLGACTHRPVPALEVRLNQGLAGTTLTAPHHGPRPQVLILAGSGPTDRDGNNPLGVQAQQYKLLAQGLANAGISSTRVDKRGMFGSAAGASDPNTVMIAQLAQDAHLWAQDIRTKTGADCVWLIGHSEGGLVALQALQNSEGLCGAILIATPGRKVGEVLREQLNANPANAPILADAFETLTRLEAGTSVDVSGFHPALQAMFAPAIQGFWKSLLQTNPTQLIKAYSGPILIIQGSSDLQVSMADAKALAAAQPRATLIELASVNHVLKFVSAQRDANLASYNDPTLPISSQVVASIADFISKNKN
jgi:uncharacterized protein